MTERQAPTVRQALAELVACKDLKERADACGYMPAGEAMSEYIAATEEYERRWPLAWSAARSALSAAAPDHTALIERLHSGARHWGHDTCGNPETCPMCDIAGLFREAATALESGVPEQPKKDSRADFDQRDERLREQVAKTAALYDEPREFDDDERQLLDYINATPALLSLLYDLDLMPEQTLRNEDARAKTFCIADHWRVDRDHPAEWVPVGERLPGAHERVVFWSTSWPDATYPGYGFALSGRWFDMTNPDRDGNSTECPNITHWLVLPPPPAADK